MEALKHKAQNEVKANRHFVVGAFGLPGSGKSECMAMFLSECQGAPLDVPTQVAYRPVDVKPMSESLFRNRGRFVAIQDDEATGEGGHKRGAMTKPNVASVQDFDAFRGRNQFVGLCAPRRVDLDSIKRGHLMFALELTLDHHLTGWEIQRPSPIFEGDGWLEERFQCEAPNIMDQKPWGPKLRKAYLGGKENHMQGGSTDLAAKSRERRQSYAKSLAAIIN